MGGMHAWLWAEKYPDMMDVVVPMASQPTAMAARNWILRRMMIETIRNDPDYNNGNYMSQPRMMKYAIAAYGFASSGGTLAYQNQAPTAEKADRMIDERLAAQIATDANDFIYQWQASHDYDAAARLSKIEATLLAINSADDERNPPETGITAEAIRQIRERKTLSDPGLHRDARPRHDGKRKVLQAAIGELLRSAPSRAM